jgi:N utilization substance protein B
MASRHRSRELAVQIVYQWELDPQSLIDPNVLDRFWKEQARSEDSNRPFFEFLVKGVANNLPMIDKTLQETLKNWKSSRVEKVDLAVLRVGLFELLYSDQDPQTDSPVVINEALEIAKKFGNSGSPGFINGILDALIKKRTPKRE